MDKINIVYIVLFLIIITIIILIISLYNLNNNLNMTDENLIKTKNDIKTTNDNTEMQFNMLNDDIDASLHEMNFIVIYPQLRFNTICKPEIIAIMGKDIDNCDGIIISKTLNEYLINLNITLKINISNIEIYNMIAGMVIKIENKSYSFDVARIKISKLSEKKFQLEFLTLISDIKTIFDDEKYTRVELIQYLLDLDTSNLPLNIEVLYTIKYKKVN